MTTERQPIDTAEAYDERDLDARSYRPILIGAPPMAGFVIGMAELASWIGSAASVALKGLRTYFTNRTPELESVADSVEPIESILPEL